MNNILKIILIWLSIDVFMMLFLVLGALYYRLFPPREMARLLPGTEAQGD